MQVGWIELSWVWLVAKGRAQMVSTVGVWVAGRATMGSEGGEERRLHGAPTRDRERIIHSFISSTNIYCVWYCARHCVRSDIHQRTSHIGELSVSLNAQSHVYVNWGKAGSVRTWSGMSSGHESQPESWFLRGKYTSKTFHQQFPLVNISSMLWEIASSSTTY